MSADFVRLIYGSRSIGAAPNHARSILNAAARNNARLGVTGMMLVSVDHFLQALEGPRAAVNDLYGRIVRDPRHEQVTLLYYAPTCVRFWPEWSMAYVALSEIEARVAEIIPGLPEGLDPLALDSEIAERLLVSLVVSRGERAPG